MANCCVQTLVGFLLVFAAGLTAWGSTEEHFISQTKGFAVRTCDFQNPVEAPKKNTFFILTIAEVKVNCAAGATLVAPFTETTVRYPPPLIGINYQSDAQVQSWIDALSTKTTIYWDESGDVGYTETADKPKFDGIVSAGAIALAILLTVCVWITCPCKCCTASRRSSSSSSSTYDPVKSSETRGLVKSDDDV